MFLIFRIVYLLGDIINNLYDIYYMNFLKKMFQGPNSNENNNEIFAVRAERDDARKGQEYVSTLEGDEAGVITKEQVQDIKNLN